MRAQEHRLAFRTSLVLGAVIAALTIAIAAADDSDSSTSTLLYPGNNFVGWVAEPMSMQDLFAQLSQLDLVYTWNAETRSYEIAAPRLPQRFWSLRMLEPGQAYVLRLSGADAVRWHRSFTPARGLVRLHSGVNWVAWVGRDNWPLDQLVRGIGTSLINIRVGDVIWPAPLDASLTDLPVLRRGDALEVTVSRDLRWLQPTGMMPKIVWIGDASESLRDAISADVQHIVDYFGEKLGVETDFSDTTLLIWKGVEAAVAYQESDQQPKFHLSGEALRVYLTYDAPGGGYPFGMHLSASFWEPPCPQSRSSPSGYCGIDLLAHEWFHYLQWHIGAGGPTLQSADAPEWMSEGTAEWGGNRGLLVFDGKRTLAQTRELTRKLAARTSVTLRSAEERNTPWQYEFGVLAVDLLVERAGLDAVVEYYRQMHHQTVGAERRYWVATNWPTAFRNAFGITVEDFYEQFEQWRSELPLEGPRYDYNLGDRTLRGSLVDAEGNPATGYWINTAPYVGENKSGRIRRTHIREDAKFSIDLAPSTTQRLWLTRDNCTMWLTDEGIATTRPEAWEHRLLDTRNLQQLNLELSVGSCGENLSIAIEVLRLRGDNRGVAIQLVSQDARVWATPSPDGSFLAEVPEPGEYQVTVRVGGCDLWFALGRLVASREDADPIELGEDLVALGVRIPHDLCARRISGQLTGVDGAHISGVWLNAFDHDVWMYAGTFSGADGTFSITVPDMGDYRLYHHQDGCFAYLGPSLSTSRWNEATVIRVEDADVTGIEFRLPDDPTSVCNEAE